MNTFVINEKKYKATPFDFNLICDLEDMGVDIANANKKPMSMVRAYFALCVNGDKEYAGKEMEAHLTKGGSFDELINAMTKEMDESDFFRNLSQSEEEKTPKSTSKKK